MREFGIFAMIFLAGSCCACAVEPTSSSVRPTVRAVDEVRLPATNDSVLLEVRDMKLPPGADGARIFLLDSSKSVESKEYVGRVATGHQVVGSNDVVINTVQEVPATFPVGNVERSSLKVLIEPLKQNSPIKGSVSVGKVTIRSENPQ